MNKESFKTIETLAGENEKLVEVELMLTAEELKTFAAYCIKKDIKFNDWIRELACDSLNALNKE
ncbi:MAG: hypothetical protein AUK54_07545 [Helicobacteraceae bacterium CG2_30_36_10]|nr:MAG: hypothetical protein AUK54_07545 [Helicobacteraceae bacterium CG2_30_36_10]